MSALNDYQLGLIARVKAAFADLGDVFVELDAEGLWDAAVQEANELCGKANVLLLGSIVDLEVVCEDCAAAEAAAEEPKKNVN